MTIRAVIAAGLLGVVAGCGSSTQAQGGPLSAFLDCVSSKRVLDSSRGAVNAGFGLLLLANTDQTIAATVIVYQPSGGGKGASAAAQLGHSAGIHFKFGKDGIRGGAVIGYTTKSPENGGPRRIANHLEAVIEQCEA